MLAFRECQRCCSEATWWVGTCVKRLSPLPSVVSLVDTTALIRHLSSISNTGGRAGGWSIIRSVGVRERCGDGLVTAWRPCLPLTPTAVYWETDRAPTCLRPSTHSFFLSISPCLSPLLMPCGRIDAWRKFAYKTLLQIMRPRRYVNVTATRSPFTTKVGLVSFWSITVIG